MFSKTIKKYKSFILRSFLSGNAYAKFVGVEYGTDCRLYTKNFGSEPFLIKLGVNVTVTAGVRFLNHDGATMLIRNSEGKRYNKYQTIEIGDNVFIGVNTILMPGVRLGDNVIIAAGSVVTKSVPCDSVFGGNPASFIMSFEKYKQKVTSSYVNDSEIEKEKKYIDKVKLAVKLHEQKD